MEQIVTKDIFVLPDFIVFFMGIHGERKAVVYLQQVCSEKKDSVKAVFPTGKSKKR